MGSSVNEFQAAKLQKEIRVACKSLEKMGYESVVIITSKDSHTEMGSARGRHFIEHFDLVVEFLSYQQGTLLAGTNDQPIARASIIQPAVTNEELDSLIEDALDTVLPSTGSDLDETNNDFDSDNDEKPQLTSKGEVIPKNKIVVMEQASVSDVMKKKSGKKRSPTCFSPSEKTNQVMAAKQKNRSVNTVNKTEHISESGKKTHDCVECNKKYARHETLVYHIRSKHTGERPYVCKDCGKSFVSRGGLRAHKHMHAEIYNFVCKECGQCFKRADYLIHHQLTHSSVKKHKCEFCDVAFKDPSTLRQHRMIHTDERPHTCEVCGHGFRSPKALREHQRVHTGEKPFTCDVCGESFRRKKNMVTHQKTKHAI